MQNSELDEVVDQRSRSSGMCLNQLRHGLDADHRRLVELIGSLNTRGGN
jgi:hypothetical protein